ncbi:MAG: hypothetical protein IEMM0008_0701 [bacterium]|nr:MAG: hypothetical protein IEMM0008_0701 [bacterium]
MKPSELIKVCPIEVGDDYLPYVTSPFGNRIYKGKHRFHHGVDMVVDHKGKHLTGRVVTCFEKAVIVFSGHYGSAGNSIILLDMSSSTGLFNKLCVSKTIYEASKTIFGVPNSIYEASKTIFGVPNSIYEASKTIFGVPNSIYEASKTIFGVPNSIYEASKNIFGVSNSICEASKNIFGVSNSILKNYLHSYLNGLLVDYFLNFSTS